MPAEEDQEIQVIQSGMSQAESNELQARLDAEEWEALLAVQHTFAGSSLLSPSEGFDDRVMQALAIHARQRALGRNIVGGILFTLASILFIAQYFWLSPLNAFIQPAGWTDLVTTLTSLVGVLAVAAAIAAAFARVLFQLIGQETVVALSVLALLLTVVWSRLVPEWAPLNRPATEA